MTERERNFILDFILGEEGGYSNDPRDAGGETKYGVADMADGRRDGMTDVDGDGRPDTRIADLTKEQAREIYAREYVAPFEALAWPVALVVVDAAVQHDPQDATRMLQRAVNAMSPRQVIMVDGRMGPLTATAARGKPARELAHRVISERLAYYPTLKGWPTYGRGWTLRMAALGRTLDWKGEEAAA